jgi:uncharacterized protein YhaN
VRVDRIQVEGFGRLVGLDTGPEPLAGLVVVLGPNEAGKSTLFAFLTTALYGFQPATREANPHVPWGSSEAAGRVRLRLEQGGCAEVERRLRSQPTGRLALAASTTELRNHPLPWVEHVPRSVFRQVFAITLSELASLDAETWARIQDKVVGSMGASDLRSARAVADALEKEAGEIWRPSRRGNQRLRDVQAAARELRQRRVAALERDERVRSLVEERESVQAELDATRDARRRERAALERVQTLLPLKQQLDRVAALRAEGGDRALLDGLPSDPPSRRAALERDREAACARRDALDADVSDAEAALARFDEPARALLARRDDVARVVARAAGCAPERARARDLEAEIGDLDARLDAAGARVLAGPWREQQDALTRLPVEVLRDRLARGAPPARPSSRSGERGWLVAALLAGAAVLGWGLVGGRASLSALGGALAAVAAVALIARLRPPERRSAPTRAGSDALELLEGIRLQPSRRQLGESLVHDLAHLRSMLGVRDERARSLAAAGARVAEADADAGRTARELGIDPSGDADAVALRLDAELRRVTRLEEAATHAERAAKRLAREHQSAAAAVDTLTAAIAELDRRGSGLAPGDPAHGLEVARARLAAHRRADELEAELQLRFPDLSALERQVAAMPSAPAEETPGPGEVATARARLEALEEAIERLARRVEALDQNIVHLRDAETVDAVDSEAAALRETEVRLARDRDRRWVLARILREADRRFREEHQPDLLRRAGSYLAHLTGGRYDRLIVDETEGGHLFRLVGPGLPAPVALAEPVSTGTLEQAYLALRLAIVDHLDRGGERLPLFVDEVFVNWDGDRRSRGLEVLATLADTRQVFVFTCHPSVAEDLVGRGGQLLTLGPTG